MSAFGPIPPLPPLGADVTNEWSLDGRPVRLHVRVLGHRHHRRGAAGGGGDGGVPPCRRRGILLVDLVGGERRRDEPAQHRRRLVAAAPLLMPPVVVERVRGAVVAGDAPQGEGEREWEEAGVRPKRLLEKSLEG